MTPPLPMSRDLLLRTSCPLKAGYGVDDIDIKCGMELCCGARGGDQSGEG
jgi:hypothetical protein